MDCSYCASVFTLLFAFFLRCYCLESLDTREPVVFLSPARGTSDSRYQGDWFGYAAIAHQMEANLNAPDVQFDEALRNTRFVQR